MVPASQEAHCVPKPSTGAVRVSSVLLHHCTGKELGLREVPRLTQSHSRAEVQTLLRHPHPSPGSGRLLLPGCLGGRAHAGRTSVMPVGPWPFLASRPLRSLRERPPLVSARLASLKPQCPSLLVPCPRHGCSHVPAHWAPWPKPALIPSPQKTPAHPNLSVLAPSRAPSASLVRCFGI